MKARVLAEVSFPILFGFMFSQLRINSKAMSQMKNSWNVLPFHINSNELGSSKYSHRSGTANATNGNSFSSVFSCFWRNGRTACILRQTQIDNNSGWFKKECEFHSLHLTWKYDALNLVWGEVQVQSIGWTLLGFWGSDCCCGHMASVGGAFYMFALPSTSFHASFGTWLYVTGKRFASSKLS